MTRINTRLDALRAIVHERPSLAGWSRICALLDAIADRSDLEVALDYLDGHLDAWPDPTRQVPAHWLERRLAFEDEPRWRVTRALSVIRREQGSAFLSRILDADAIKGLTHLTLHLGHWRSRASRLQPIDAARLAACPHARTLEYLDLDDQAIGADGARYLSHAANLSGLRALRLRRNAIGDVGAVHIATSPLWQRLQMLNLAANRLSDAGAVALSKSTTLVNLADLELSANAIGPDGAQALARAPHLPEPVRARWGSVRPGRLVVEIETETPQRVSLFERDDVVLGRSARADVRLNRVSVSEEHVRLVHNGTHATLEVCDSAASFPTVNNQRVQRHTLSAGEYVVVGGVRIRVVEVPEEGFGEAA